MLQLLILVGRALASGLRGHRELVLENLALRQQLMAMKRAHNRPRLQLVTGCFGLPCDTCGRTGAPHSSWFDRRPWWAGIARGSAGNGPDAQYLERTAVRPSRGRSAPLSVR